MAPAPPAGRTILHRVNNPPNPWKHTEVEWVGEPPAVRLELFEDTTKSILSKNTSPDIGFDYSVNPYRGCYHGCAYCYARPTHNYLDFGAGTDFERKLVYKPRAAELLRAAFDRPRWRGDLVVFSGNTDCYQPLEASMQLTRACLEVCLAYRNPVSIITKSTLIERDLDLLVALSKVTHLRVTISLPFLNADHARAIEPYVPTPKRRLQMVRRLAEAGIYVGVNAAPIIPGLNDDQLPGLMQAAADAGAHYVGRTLVRLPGPVLDVFSERVRALLPLSADKILAQVREARGGEAMNDSRFGHRMRGAGRRWDAIEALFQQTRARLGLEAANVRPVPATFRRPPKRSQQLSLL